MKDCFNQDNYDIHSSLLSNPSLDKCNNTHRQSGHQKVIIKNLEQSLKHDESSTNNQSTPNYYEWSLCDIDSAYDDIFNQMSTRTSQLLTDSENSQLESLSYFNCKKIGEFSSVYDRIIHGGYIYPQQHFGTSQMNKPHPMRNSIPCEETFRWLPVRSSSMIGRRAHLPLDIFDTTPIVTKQIANISPSFKN